MEKQDKNKSKIKLRVGSKYQRRRFTLLFLQYCETIIVERESYKTQELSSRLGVSGLSDLLSDVGPSTTLEKAKQFIYEYDSTLTGTLGIDDFLEFFEDYCALMRQARDSSVETWKNQQGEDDLIPQNPDIDNYLLSLGLDDPMGFLAIEEPIAEKIKSTFLIEDPHLLCRTISIRLFACNNLFSCCGSVFINKAQENTRQKD